MIARAQDTLPFKPGCRSGRAIIGQLEKFILRVTVHAEYVWIECEDAGGPWLARHSDGRPHGLDVVHALCGEDGWGVEDLDSGRTGRVVWARLGLDRSGI
jgi:hypothetical protein